MGQLIRKAEEYGRLRFLKNNFVCYFQIPGNRYILINAGDFLFNYFYKL
jgi:hypothetical protein